MTLLVVFPEDDSARLIEETRDPETIAARLAGAGIRFEQWQAAVPLAPGASQDDVLAAYRTDIERLNHERGYRSADVVRLTPAPEDPGWRERAAAARQKFLEEHTHAE